MLVLFYLFQSLVMFYAYVLASQKKDIFYYGSTAHIELRLQQHNDGLVTFTSKFRPWKLIYFEVFSTRSEAMKREKIFKSGKGRQWLKNIITNSS